MLQKILTADQTETFLNEELKETYHSQTGAVEEAFRKYVFPCRIKELARTGKIRILDICFGLGYNSAAALDAAWEANKDCQIDIIGLENDLEIISRISEVNPPIKNYFLLKKLKKSNSKKREISKKEISSVDKDKLYPQSKKNLELKEKNLSIKILLGDARETIKELKSNSFDAVFLDPFSPKTSPEMWQLDFFKEIYRVIKQNCILATYTCARLARENMKKAGFNYNDGPIVGRRGPGTIAWKKEFFKNKISKAFLILLSSFFLSLSRLLFLCRKSHLTPFWLLLPF